MKLTLPQKKALAALGLLGAEEYHSRYKAGFATGKWQGQQLRTMKVLWGLGLVAPEYEMAVKLVESGACSCGCDRWRLTAKGREYVSTLNIHVAEPLYLEDA